MSIKDREGTIMIPKKIEITERFCDRCGQCVNISVVNDNDSLTDIGWVRISRKGLYKYSQGSFNSSHVHHTNIDICPECVNAGVGEILDRIEKEKRDSEL